MTIGKFITLYNCSLWHRLQRLRYSWDGSGTAEQGPVSHWTWICPVEPPWEGVVPHPMAPCLRIILTLPVCSHIFLWVATQLPLAECSVIPAIIRTTFFCCIECLYIVVMCSTRNYLYTIYEEEQMAEIGRQPFYIPISFFTSSVPEMWLPWSLPVVGGHVGFSPVQYCLVLGNKPSTLNWPVHCGGSELLYGGVQ